MYNRLNKSGYNLRIHFCGGIMTTVYFVRHAEPNYNNHDVSLRELSAKGLKDRKLVTAFLADKEIDAALSSPYKRAILTASDLLRNRPERTFKVLWRQR